MSRSQRLVKAVLGTALRWLFRIEVKGLENYWAASGPTIIVCNHQSFLDAPILASLLPERVAFAINPNIADAWWVRPWLSLVKVYRIDPAHPYAAASLVKALRRGGGKCVIFPEGRITETGALMKVYDGPAMVADRTGAQVLPAHLEGAQFSLVSRLGGKVRRRLAPKITLTLLPPRRLDVPELIKGRARRRAAGALLYDLMSETVFETAPQDLTVFEALLAARRRYGGRTGIVDDVDRNALTYNRLVLGALVLGRKLADLTRAGESVGVFLPNASGSAVAWLGLVAFGRVPAMLNVTAGPAALTSALSVAGVKLVITARRFIEKARLEATADALAEIATVVYLDDLRATIGLGDKLRGLIDLRRARAVHRAARGAAGPDDRAVILFTSGSEGPPKGVALSHRNIVANCRQAAARVDFTPSDTVLNVLPLFHAFGLTAGFVLPLVYGVRCVLYPSPLHYRLVPEVAYHTNATILFGTDTFLFGYGRVAHPYDFRALRYVFAGAERLRAPTRSLWNDKFGIRILEGYGVTETSPVLALNTPIHCRAGTVGRLIPGVQYRLEPVEGIASGGRLVVKGPNIMMGYLAEGDPNRVIAPPDGWYDTGDVVEVDRTGFVTIVGRLKRFAKVGGEMVPLAAIEGVIAELWPDDRHGAIAIADPRKGERIVLATTHAGATRAEVVEAARAAGLAEVASPRDVVPLPEWPLLASGKTDYPQLKRVVADALGLGAPSA